jgi:hypothetical protein
MMLPMMLGVMLRVLRHRRDGQTHLQCRQLRLPGRILVLPQDAYRVNCVNIVNVSDWKYWRENEMKTKTNEHDCGHDCGHLIAGMADGGCGHEFTRPNQQT